jgi:putative spermidine/putrescine transport system substrate-binding protein
MLKRDVVPAELKAKLPDPALIANSVVPNGDQLTKARALIKEQWDAVVGLDIKPAK